MTEERGGEEGWKAVLYCSYCDKVIFIPSTSLSLSLWHN